MSVSEIHEASKTIKVLLPVTEHTGKIRVKQRNMFIEYGLPIATRQKPLNQNCYMEWQISYGTAILEFGVDNEKPISFQLYNDKNNHFSELSEYLYYFMKWGVISPNEINELKTQLKLLKEQDFISNNPHCQIKRTELDQTLNICGSNFLMMKAEYPQLIYDFKPYNLIAEITIKEKQRAVGNQPMLYVCIPVSELITNPPLIGRSAATKEHAEFILDENNYEVVLHLVKIFGILSPAHRTDIINIIDKILEILD